MMAGGEWQFLQQYGLAGAIVLVFVAAVLPVVKEQVLPAWREGRRRREALEDRQVAALEKLGESVAGLGAVLNQIDQRLSNVERVTGESRDGVRLLLERTAPTAPALRRRDGLERGE